MSVEEIAAQIQFVVDGRGNVTSVVLSPDAWRELIASLEHAEDRALLAGMAPKLAAGPKDALRWTDAEAEWA